MSRVVRIVRCMVVASLTPAALLAVVAGPANAGTHRRVYEGSTSQGSQLRLIILREPGTFLVASFSLLVSAECSDGTTNRSIYTSAAGGAIARGRWSLQTGATEYAFDWQGTFGPGNGWPTWGRGTVRYDEYLDTGVACSSGPLTWNVRRVH